MEHTKDTQKEWQEIQKQIQSEIKSVNFNDEYLINAIGEDIGKNWIQEQFPKNKRGIKFMIELRKKIEINNLINSIIYLNASCNSSKIVEDIITNLDEHDAKSNINRLKELEAMYDKKMAEITYGNNYLFFPHSPVKLIKRNSTESSEYSPTDERWADYYYFILCFMIRMSITNYRNKKSAFSKIEDLFSEDQNYLMEKSKKIIKGLEEATKIQTKVTLTNDEIFKDFFQNQNTEKLIEKLSRIIKNKQGKALYTIILALQRKKIMRGINDKELKKLYECLTSYFENIGRYESLRKAKELYKKGEEDIINGFKTAYYISESDIENIMKLL